MLDLNLAMIGVSDTATGTWDLNLFRCGCFLQIRRNPIVVPLPFGPLELPLHHRKAEVCSRQHAIELARTLNPERSVWHMEVAGDRFEFAA